MLKLIAKYEKLCVHGEKKPYHIFLFSIYLLIFLCCWVFTAAHRLSLVVVSGGPLVLVVHGLHIAVSSLVAEHRLKACGLQ